MQWGMDLVWVSISERAAESPGADEASRFRRITLSAEGRSVGEYSRELWPQLEWELKRRGRSGFFLKLEDAFWPSTLVRAIAELSPRVVHFQYHSDFWPGRTLLRGDFTAVNAALRKRLPATQQWATMHGGFPQRRWGAESGKYLDVVCAHTEKQSRVEAGLRLSERGPRWLELPALTGGPQNTQAPGGGAVGSVPGVRGTVSRGDPWRPSLTAPTPVIGGAGVLAQKLVEAYF